MATEQDVQAVRDRIESSRAALAAAAREAAGALATAEADQELAALNDEEARLAAELVRSQPVDVVYPPPRTETVVPDAAPVSKD